MLMDLFSRMDGVWGGLVPFWVSWVTGLGLVVFFLKGWWVWGRFVGGVKQIAVERFNRGGSVDSQWRFKRVALII